MLVLPLGFQGCNVGSDQCYRDTGSLHWAIRAVCAIAALVVLWALASLVSSQRARQLESDGSTSTSRLAVMLQRDELGFLALIGEPAACLPGTGKQGLRTGHIPILLNIF